MLLLYSLVIAIFQIAETQTATAAVWLLCVCVVVAPSIKFTFPAMDHLPMVPQWSPYTHISPEIRILVRAVASLPGLRWLYVGTMGSRGFWRRYRFRAVVGSRFGHQSLPRGWHLGHSNFQLFDISGAG